MSTESTRAVMERYWNADHGDDSMLAEDVVYTMMSTGDEYRTPQGVQELLNYFYHVAFDAIAATENTVVTDGKAVLEAYVVGKHIGEFAGIPATGKDIRVPICVVYDLENDQIKRARIYFETPVLFRQLGVNMATTQT